MDKAAFSESVDVVDVCYCSEDDDDSSDAEGNCHGDTSSTCRDDVTRYADAQAVYHTDNEDDNASSCHSDDHQSSDVRYSSHDTSFDDADNSHNDAIDDSESRLDTDDARNNNRCSDDDKPSNSSNELSFGISRILTEDSHSKPSPAKRPSLDSIVSNLTTLRDLQAHQTLANQSLAYGYFQRVLSSQDGGDGGGGSVVIKVPSQRVGMIGGLPGPYGAGSSVLPWMQERKDRLTS